MDVGFSEQVIVHSESISSNEFIDSAYTIDGFVNLKRLPFKIVFQNDILPAAKKVARKAPAKKAAKKATAEKPAPATRPSNDAIARAAYLNYRRRVEQGLPGDSRGDWLEAERQLGIATQP